MKILVTWHWRTVTRMVKPVISALLIHIKRVLSMLTPKGVDSVLYAVRLKQV